MLRTPDLRSPSLPAGRWCEWLGIGAVAFDAFSVSVGFLLGAITGAAGSYFGAKFTDQRRRQEAQTETDIEWQEICRRFPLVIEEMRRDIGGEEARGVRIFFLKSSRSMLQFPGPHFQYHTDIHPEIAAAVAYLEEAGYVEDITRGNVPKYRMREILVDRLREA